MNLNQLVILHSHLFIYMILVYNNVNRARTRAELPFSRSRALQAPHPLWWLSPNNERRTRATRQSSEHDTWSVRCAVVTRSHARFACAAVCLMDPHGRVASRLLGAWPHTTTKTTTTITESQYYQWTAPPVAHLSSVDTTVAVVVAAANGASLSSLYTISTAPHWPRKLRKRFARVRAISVWVSLEPRAPRQRRNTATVPSASRCVAVVERVTCVCAFLPWNRVWVSVCVCVRVSASLLAHVGLKLVLIFFTFYRYTQL